MNTGTLYGVGIGPGDPKLMTFRAAELIRNNEIIALPGEKAEETVAYQIAVQTVEELKQKTFLELPMPMTKDRELLEKSHEEAGRPRGGVSAKRTECSIFNTWRSDCVFHLSLCT